MHIYTLHRDARNFSPSPERFIPERWLPRDEQLRLEPDLFQDEAKIVHNTAAFIPFSFGPSDCIGKRLGMQEIRMVVCAMLQHFELRFAEDYDPRKWEEDMYDFFVVRKGRLPVLLTHLG